jgi:NAD-dependent SIR2 family protein deacetylase
MKSALHALKTFIADHPRLIVVTGAGISNNSGIPTYRDARGSWQRREPIQHQRFLDDELCRQRYWARSLLGWDIVRRAQPNMAHRVLEGWERDGKIIQLVTQNVDGLHRAAGSNNVLELHGRLDRARCLQCYAYVDRNWIQKQLIASNPELWQFIQTGHHQAGPDGDAEVDDWPHSSVHCPSCPKCNGTLMPDVVFFGGSVPKARVELVYQNLQQANGLLIIGSSMMTLSAYRFCKYAKQHNIAIAAINLGVTRADDLLACKLEMDCTAALRQL